MKLSQYHKSLGDSVEFIEKDSHYDMVYISKTFNLPSIRKIPTCPPNFYADEIKRGGTGYAIKIVDGKEVFERDLHKDLPCDIEHLYPDYSIYPDYAGTSYGFLTR